MHNLRTVDILVSACLYQKTNLQSKHTPGRVAVLAVLRESRTMPIKELCRWPNIIICCQPIDSLDYMANRQNKQCFIFMLSEGLKKNNCEVHHVSGNADLLIVMKAVQSANSSNTVLVGDDTDLLVLLCHHASI